MAAHLSRKPGVRRILQQCLVAGIALAAVSVTAAPMVTELERGLFGFTASNAPVDIRAARVEYDRAGECIRAVGGVTIQRGNDVLQADEVTVNTRTQEVEARGHVVWTRDRAVWRGEVLQYNLGTGFWRTGAFTAYFDPFYVAAREAAKTSTVEYVLHNAVLTTCCEEYPHYALVCREVYLIPGDRLKAWHVVLWLGPVPVFYVPFWYRSLGDRTVGFSAEAGYRNRMGAFLLTSTKYALSPQVRGVTQLDYRSRRGWAAGQEVGWRSAADRGQGRLYGYYAEDQGIEEDYEGEDRSRVDRQRYRLRLSQSYALTGREYLLTDWNYLSDPFVLEDFFDSEYRGGFQPPNFLTLTHRGDGFSAGLSLYKRLNDFYDAVDRLPELTLEIPRLPVAGTPLYYESRNALAWLEKLWSDEHTADSNRQDYSALRADSQHMLYYPTRHWGFLNVIPRSGARITYYSDTVTRQETNVVVTRTVTNLVAGPSGASVPEVTTRVETNHILRETPRGADTRLLFELGAEVSYRAYRVLHNEPFALGTGLRHVVEPYANYTLVPEPNLTPEELYQFDEVDTLDEQHNVRFGVRNRWQTRWDGAVHDLVDLDTWTTWWLKRDGADALRDVNWDAEIKPTPRLQLNVDGTYSLENEQLAVFNSRLTLREEAWKIAGEYRYRYGDTSLLMANLGYSPNKSWTLEVYQRYEFEEGRLEEQGYGVTHKLDCLGIRLGFSHLPAYTRSDGTRRDDDYRAYVQVWLTAFPDVRLGTTPRY